MRSYSLVLIFAIALFSCNAPPRPELTSSEKDIIVRDVRQMLSEYYAAVNARGLTAEFDYLDSSDEFFWVPPGSRIPLSYDSIYRAISQNASLFEAISNKWDTLHVIPLTLDLATYSGQLTSAMTDTSGISSKIRLVETGLVIRRRDGWKLLSGQTAVAE